MNPKNESILNKNDFPILLKVGIKNVLSLNINIDHSNYNCRGTLKGFVYFNSVNSNIKCMEAQLIRREIIFDGKKYEPENIATYELIDGGPSEQERLPFRFFLKSYNITPSYPNIEEIFGVKYFINFVIVDNEDNRYFKFAEINLYRLFSNRRTHLSNFDNNGLFITKPFFEDEYSYKNNTLNSFVNPTREDNYYENDNYVGDNNYIESNDYNDNHNKIRNNRNNNLDNNIVLNIPGEDFDNYNLRNGNYKNDFNRNNNNISRLNQRLNRRNNAHNNYNHNNFNDKYINNVNHNNINYNQKNQSFNDYRIENNFKIIMMIMLKILKINFIKIIIET